MGHRFEYHVEAVAPYNSTAFLSLAHLMPLFPVCSMDVIRRYNELNKCEPLDKANIVKNFLEFDPFILGCQTNCQDQNEHMELIDAMTVCENVVDVSCSDGGNYFNGNPIFREQIQLKLSVFMNYFNCCVLNQHHYLKSTELNLYLSQCSLYSDSPAEPAQLSSLFQHLKVPALLIDLDQKLSQVNVWINVQRAISSMHYDANHNMLTVHKGVKHVMLVSPANTAHLAATAAHCAAPNHSTLTPQQVDQLCANGVILNGVHKVTVSEGECLFIPEGWWHSVESEPCSVAVNYWFRSPLWPLLHSPAATHMQSYILRASLHNLVSCKETEPSSVSVNVSGNDRKSSSRERRSGYFTDEEFRSLVTRVNHCRSELNAIGSTAHDSTHNSGAGCMSEAQSVLEGLCMELVSCSVADMIRVWIPFSLKHADDWTAALLALTPEAVHTLVSYWDTLSGSGSNDGNSASAKSSSTSTSTSGDIGSAARKEKEGDRREENDTEAAVSQEQVQQFFVDIFAGCGDQCPEVRSHLIVQKDLRAERKARNIVHHVLGTV